MTDSENETHEKAMGVIDHERIEIERTVVDVPAMGISGVLLKLSIARYWIELDTREPDTEDRMTLSAYDDLERSLAEAHAER